MKEITNIISDYLKNKKTDFAFFINGQWGSGKTYFLKNKLFSEIKNIETPISTKEKPVYFEPVYISLFGVSNADEIYERLSLELNPMLKTKSAFILKKILYKGASVFNVPLFEKSDAKDYLSVFSIPKHKVLFLDDLERIEKDCLNGILGNINTFVEHQNLKTIIVGDEKILEEKITDYKKIKEKLIRFTCAFEADMKNVFDDMTQLYSDDYKTFLIANKDFICDLYAKGEHKNLRTLHFTLDIFEKIFHALDSLKKNKYHNKILDRFLYFSTTYSIEYKKEQDNDNLQYLQNVSNRFVPLKDIDLSSSNHFADNKKEESKEETYGEMFREKYLVFDNHRFEYSSEIARYIHSGFLDEKELLNQADSIITELTHNETSEESEIIKKLGNLFLLEDDELQPLFEEVLQKVENGDFDLIAYPNIFSFFMKIEYLKLENFSINERLYEIFQKGMDISKARAKYNEAFRYKIPFWDSSDTLGKEKYQRIADYATAANDSLFEIQQNNYANEIFSLIQKNKGQEVYNYMVNSEFQLVPILSFLNPENVFYQLKESRNNTIMYFHDGIRGKYLSNIILEKLNPEIQFFSELLNIINQYIQSVKDEDRKINVVCFEFIQKAIVEIIKKHESNSY